MVVPVHNEEACLPLFHSRLSAALRSPLFQCEVIYVDDGSSDGSLALLEKLQLEDPAVAVVVLSRNFGHQAALSAGMDLARGAAVVTLDADLQHPPEMIPALIEEWRRGAKVVATVREATEDAGVLKKASSGLYYRLLNLLSDTAIEPYAADFRLLDRQALTMLKSMPERQRFLRGMIGWLGLPEARLPFSAAPRAAGASKYTLPRMMRLGLDGILSFSTKPLRLALWLGLMVLAVNALYAAYILYSYWFNQATVRGWPSMILLIMFLGSSQLILLGVAGEYIGRVYEEVKGRPLYLARELRPHRLAL